WTTGQSAREAPAGGPIGLLRGDAALSDVAWTSAVPNGTARAGVAWLETDLDRRQRAGRAAPPRGGNLAGTGWRWSSWRSRWSPRWCSVSLATAGPPSRTFTRA